VSRAIPLLPDMPSWYAEGQLYHYRKTFAMKERIKFCSIVIGQLMVGRFILIVL
jgi:hypothetical protein